MSDQVLSDEQLREACGCWILGVDDTTCDHATARAIERAVIAALAARGGVDVEALAKSSCHDMPCYCEQVTEDEWRQCPECPWHGQWPLVDIVVDALRLALAISEARHAERERPYCPECNCDRCKAHRQPGVAHE